MSNPRRLCAADACLFLHEKSEGVMLFPASFRKTGAALFKAAFFLRPKTPRYAGSSKKAKPLNTLKKGFLCEITSCLDSKSIHKGTQ